jgi:epoxyqueuosine reductase QueG
MTELLTTQGVPLMGVCTKETLAGGPPSTDLEYVLPGAKSAITFAVPLDQEKIELYLSKQDHAAYQFDPRGCFMLTG